MQSASPSIQKFHTNIFWRGTEICFTLLYLVFDSILSLCFIWKSESSHLSHMFRFVERRCCNRCHVSILLTSYTSLLLEA